MMMMLMFSLQMGRGMPEKQKVMDLFISQGSRGAEKQNVLDLFIAHGSWDAKRT
jgi:hypothetical protein